MDQNQQHNILHLIFILLLHVCNTCNQDKLLKEEQPELCSVYKDVLLRMPSTGQRREKFWSALRICEHSLESITREEQGDIEQREKRSSTGQEYICVYPGCGYQPAESNRMWLQQRGHRRQLQRKKEGAGQAAERGALEAAWATKWDFLKVGEKRQWQKNERMMVKSITDLTCPHFRTTYRWDAAPQGHNIPNKGLVISYHTSSNPVLCSNKFWGIEILAGCGWN